MVLNSYDKRLHVWIVDWIYLNDRICLESVDPFNMEMENLRFAIRIFETCLSN